MGDLGIGIVVISMLISIGIIVGLLRSGAKSESWPVFFQKFWINAFIYTAFILGLRGAATGFHSSASVYWRFGRRLFDAIYFHASRQGWTACSLRHPQSFLGIPVIQTPGK